ncbi:MAG: UDP-N-acetylmuramoyl-tripeptide--D-alanyl-D-alanine ligase, partial [Nitrospinaceae bacterium]|nr:UDP-N-acetylmuramoyl-tripeptide--D-alanyl-D-alanine ligase [Nitrospinaceae bacterium]NIR55246.1 UDP-N-acetylmuramoyl-tripeptide--D-alanyl-D-alanine ligase [Nitrospinaceae bacterium]NIS85684.1 UDP-N-acetylmuramoyl-tripeptide--D-alanyl-D-alanine ligase [Nitrospinaceae bacterium]NIT82535.1 UDP-N-acetylmuramoyl-tripeptide--D-alanyl-D-alanine ligase [Nitrospinaceae bacterium]NIU44739.1 UDP-N-acetylmuramoyl-tripeptide--D-alanyl-D-alanine ligase [Nitrospinaceae bacterium]
MNSDFQTLVTAVKGERILGKEAQSFKGVSIDSRTVRQDQLFICIKGDRFDGHDFIDEVAQKKAAGVVVSDKEKLDGSRIKDSGLFAVAVPDTIRALQDLAEYHRNRFDVRVIGVTGTNGKTTTKEIIANVIKMKYPALKTEGNLNNHIGLPLTLLELSRSHKSAVLEMGMSAAGEIRRLAEIAKPRIGVITNISMAHMTHLKTLKDIQAAKGELFRELNQYGTAVVNADDPLVCELARKIRAKVITFGIENKADVQASDIRPGNFSGYDFTLSLKGKQVPAHVPLIGRFNIYNALAAAAVGYVLEVPVSMIQNGLKARQDLHQRCESILYKNMTILNDTYNANPRSMSEAMKILKEHKAPGKKIMVVG